MRSSKKNVLAVLILGFCIQLQSVSYAKLPSFVKTPLEQLSECSESNIQFLHIVRSLAYLPSIFVLGSESAAAIQATALLNMAASTTKVAHDLLKTQEKTTLARLLVTDFLKVAGYSSSMMYDMMCLLEAAGIAEQNKKEITKEGMKSMQINQLVLWSIETLLRLVAMMGYYGEATGGTIDKVTARLTGEVADFVEICRLLSRLKSFLSLDKIQATINVEVTRMGGIYLSDKDFYGEDLGEEQQQVKQHEEQPVRVENSDCQQV